MKLRRRSSQNARAVPAKRDVRKRRIECSSDSDDEPLLRRTRVRRKTLRDELERIDTSSDDEVIIKRRTTRSLSAQETIMMTDEDEATSFDWAAAPLKKQNSAQSSKASSSEKESPVCLEPVEKRQPIVIAFDENTDSPSEAESSSSSDDESDDPDLESIEKILGRRVVVQSKPDGSSQKNIEEFLVKMKDTSYIHCEWRSRQRLEKDPADQQRVRRFVQQETAKAMSVQKEQQAVDNENEEESIGDFAKFGAGTYFPIAYCRVDRVFDHDFISNKEVSLKELMKGKEWDMCQFLVRWQQQGYEDATWETYEDLKALPDRDRIDREITRYFQFCMPLEPEKYSKLSKKGSSGESGALPAFDFSDGLSLRDYQVEGVKFLTFNWTQNRNSILADEMGLGKTVQISAFINHLSRNENIRGPFLVVAPLSTLQHWRRECELWDPHLNCLVYHGTAPARVIIRDHEFFYGGTSPNKPFKFDILVTSYEMAIADSKILSKIDWDLLVIDESHRLKNRDCKLFKELVRYQSRHTIMLTGTPVQNTTRELWVLLHFIDPDTFDDLDEFQEKFGDLRHKEDVDALHALLKPYFLRRMKSDVEKGIPERQEIIIDVEMTTLQKRLYKSIYDRNTDILFKSSAKPSLLNVGMQLRKCCNHPYLIKGVEDHHISLAPTEEERMNQLVASSGKFVLLDKLLPKLQKEGHRVLIFSQMTKMLDIIEDYLNSRQFKYNRIDGNITGASRQQAIDSFTRLGDIFIFMLSTRAGGVGINLTAADTVIIFDSDWNPQNDLQAQARCHRIGQTQNVKVYRLITKNTYEMAMFDRASKKLGLDQAVLHPMRAKTRGRLSEELTKEEIENLLKNGAYSILDKNSDQKSKEFCEKDIDDILASNTRLIQYSSNPTMTGSSFAKASFVIATENGEEPIDINDPNFWQKVGLIHESAAKENVPTEENLPSKRTRSKIQRFGFTPAEKASEGSDSDTDESFTSPDDEATDDDDDDNDSEDDETEQNSPSAGEVLQKSNSASAGQPVAACPNLASQVAAALSHSQIPATTGSNLFKQVAAVLLKQQDPVASPLTLQAIATVQQSWEPISLITEPSVVPKDPILVQPVISEPNRVLKDAVSEQPLASEPNHVASDSVLERPLIPESNHVPKDSVPVKPPISEPILVSKDPLPVPQELNSLVNTEGQSNL